MGSRRWGRGLFYFVIILCPSPLLNFLLNGVLLCVYTYTSICIHTRTYTLLQLFLKILFFKFQQKHTKHSIVIISGVQSGGVQLLHAAARHPSGSGTSPSSQSESVSPLKINPSLLPPPPFCFLSVSTELSTAGSSYTRNHTVFIFLCLT